MRSSFGFRALSLGGGVEVVYPPGEAYIVEDDAEFQQMTSGSSPVTQQEIFNTWGRFAGTAWYPSGTSPSGEATAWTYNTSTQQVQTTLNSSNYIGFVSPNTVDYYEHEVTMSSTDSDDDLIGLVVAFYLNGSVPTSIIAARTQGNLGLSGSRWGLAQVSGNTVQMLANGTNFITTTSGGWSDADNVKIHVKRSGNLIEVITSQNNSTTLDPQTKLSWTMPSNSPFIGPKSYGYVAYSQDAATFKNISLKGSLDTSVVYRLMDDGTVKVWVYDGSIWFHDSSRTIQGDSLYPRELTNPITKKKYYLTATGLTKIS